MNEDTKQNLPLTKRNPSTANKIITVIADKVIDLDRNVPDNERLAILNAEQKMHLQQVEDEAIRHFAGALDELESALGMLRVGHHLGWKVLYIAHSKKTIRKYEEILNIKIREVFPERGPSSKRSIGLGFAERISNFWKVVSGEIKIDNRRDIQ